ncbi:MAG TPA: polysaccharide deacetylase family protein [Chitinophagaceae bacterium]|nr:polysaccharide deacetylase family protein [Chitinophagaceae bacterium]
MIIFSTSITHRLQYTCNFISKELTGLPALLTDSKNDYAAHHGIKINYSTERIANEELWLDPHSLLFEKDIKPQLTDCFETNGYKAFFKTEGDLPFDIFAASFYLLSRYEEYLPHKKDMYGRYAHENSMAFKEDFLNLPVINIWLQNFRASLLSKFPESRLPNPDFSFLPTYDIDEAYSYKHKGWKRSAGAAVKDIFKGKMKNFALRRKVLNNKAEDPFDAYDWMDNLHRQHKLKPCYFFHVAGKTGKYDRNISPTETAMQRLIRRHADKYAIGVHPSWQSGDNPSLIKKEIETIEGITKTKITSSRQHFIRFSLPDTYRQLIEAGIKEDFSMGYGSINGFRASVASPFYWYDLEREQNTHLLLYPFCYMEANSFYEQKQNPDQALQEMQHYYNGVKKVNGTLITIWHNTFLGTEEKFRGWRECYKKFFDEVAGQTDTARPG